MTAAGRCACEHVAHCGEAGALTPGGAVGHPYGAVPAVTRVRTAFGTFGVCEACAADCFGALAVGASAPAARGLAVLEALPPGVQ